MKSFNRNSKKYNLYELTPIEIYELVRSGKLKKFPMYFWQCDESDEYSPLITRHMIENILHWNDEDIKKNLRKSTFRQNSLGGLLNCKCKDSPSDAICKAYPEKKFMPWDFVNAPNHYWRKAEGRQNAINAVKWLIEEKLQWSEDDIITKLNHQIFSDNNLLGMLKKAFNSTLFEAMEAAYPGKFKKWQLGDHVENSYWNREEGILAVKWLIDHNLRWTDDDIKKKYSKTIFKANNLYGMIQRCFNTSPYEAINAAYPDRFKEWELSNVPRNFWNAENCTKAFRWLIHEKLPLDKSSQKQKLTKKTFKEHGLISLYEKYSVSQLLEMINRV